MGGHGLRKVLMVLGIASLVPMFAATSWSQVETSVSSTSQPSSTQPSDVGTRKLCSPNPALCIDVESRPGYREEPVSENACLERGGPCLEHDPNGVVPFRVEADGTISCVSSVRGNSGGGSGGGSIGAYAGTESGSDIPRYPDAPCGRYGPVNP
jgi:hypothetical protein